MPELALCTRRLLEQGLIRPAGEEQFEPTARWRGAVARATLYLLAIGEDEDDLRIPFAAALIEQFGEDSDDRELAEMVDLMVRLERPASVDPSLRR